MCDELVCPNCGSDDTMLNPCIECEGSGEIDFGECEDCNGSGENKSSGLCAGCGRDFEIDDNE